MFLRQSTSWAQQVRLLASNARSNASFGSSVALFRDALAVGSVGESSASRGVNGDQQDASAQGAGAVYLFTRSLGLWSADGYFKASNTTASAQFGSAVALSGTTLAITARGESGAGHGINSSTAGSSSNSGAAYLFSKEPLGWRQVAYVKANAPDADDAFGQSVALSANTLVIGSPGEASSTRGVDTGSPDNAAPNAGAVLIFGK